MSSAPAFNSKTYPKWIDARFKKQAPSWEQLSSERHLFPIDWQVFSGFWVWDSSRWTPVGIKYTQGIDNHWTPFWSPIGSWWEFRTKLENFSPWIVFRVYFAFAQNRKHPKHCQIKNNTSVFNHVCRKTKDNACGKSETPWGGLWDPNPCRCIRYIDKYVSFTINIINTTYLSSMGQLHCHCNCPSLRWIAIMHVCMHACI